MEWVRKAKSEEGNASRIFLWKMREKISRLCIGLVFPSSIMASSNELTYSRESIGRLAYYGNTLVEIYALARDKRVQVRETQEGLHLGTPLISALRPVMNARPNASNPAPYRVLPYTCKPYEDLAMRRMDAELEISQHVASANSTKLVDQLAGMNKTAFFCEVLSDPIAREELILEVKHDVARQRTDLAWIETLKSLLLEVVGITDDMVRAEAVARLQEDPDLIEEAKEALRDEWRDDELLRDEVKEELKQYDELRQEAIEALKLES